MISLFIFLIIYHMNVPSSIEISQAQRDFIQACSSAWVLKFDPNNWFKLKSWRQSPWFFQAWELMKDAQWLAMLGKIYVDALLKNFATDGKNIDADVLYGPAYKGIPIASTAASEYYNQTGNNIGFAFHRKEVKDHGEGGTAFWMSVKDKTAILLDDVMTAGTALTGSQEEIDKDGGKLSGAIVLLDRQEVKNEWDTVSALNRIGDESGIKIVSALNYQTVRQAIREWLIGNSEIWAAMDQYFQKYGA